MYYLYNVDNYQCIPVTCPLQQLNGGPVSSGTVRTFFISARFAMGWITICVRYGKLLFPTGPCCKRLNTVPDAAGMRRGEAPRHRVGLSRARLFEAVPGTRRRAEPEAARPGAHAPGAALFFFTSETCRRMVHRIPGKEPL